MDEILHSGADISDYEIAQKSPEEIGYPFLRGAQGLPAEAVPYENDPIDSYEETKGFPYTAAKLGYNENFKIDPQIEMKIRAVDEYVIQKMQEEGTSTSKIGFDTIFNRMIQMLGESPEESRNRGTLSKIVDSLFLQVSIANRKSSQVYLKDFTKQYETKRIQDSLLILKAALA
jgi:hypothetical protein